MNISTLRPLFCLFEGLLLALVVLALLPFKTPCFTEHSSSRAPAALGFAATGVEADHEPCQTISAHERHEIACEHGGLSSESMLVSLRVLNSAQTALTAKMTVAARFFTATPVFLPQQTARPSTVSLLVPSVTLQIHKRTVLLI